MYLVPFIKLMLRPAAMLCNSNQILLYINFEVFPHICIQKSLSEFIICLKSREGPLRLMVISIEIEFFQGDV